MVNRLIRLIVLISAVAHLFTYTAKAAAEPIEDIIAVSALLAEADTGVILFEKNINKKHPADSLAKIMTLLLVVSAIENKEARTDELIEMTESAWFDVTSKNSTQNIKPGEAMTLIDLMYSAYVGGSNEACNMIAERIDGSVETFIERMNAYAHELGCENTNFVNTHGQHSSEQYTTAQDQFTIFRDAMGKELFTEISGVFKYTTGVTNKSSERSYTSTNGLLNVNGKYYYRYCTAGQTSVTFEGGHSFVAFAEAEGLSLISVVLGSDDIILEDKTAELRNLTESRRLLEWGFSAFNWRVILSSRDPVAKAPIINGAGADFVNLRPETEIRLLLDNDISDNEFIKKITIYSEESNEPLVAPIVAGTVLGELTLTRNGENHGTVKLIANTSIELHRLEYAKIQIESVMSNSTTRTVIAVLVVIIVLYLSLVIRYNIVRRKKLRKIANAKKRLANQRQQRDNKDS